ncbi:MAG: hypothetical protein M0P31_02405 [Solirubrobacteraceae bacterium]|nr:hypothetical protein [Solirubrobacteraceae bacterium]
MTAALLAVTFVAAVAFVTRPLWPGRAGVLQERDALRRADLEAAKAAKYREILDAGLDHDTGKLSDEDWRAIDRRLRAEAVEILHALDGLDAAAAGPERADDDPRATTATL